jgi:hypothetical protein
MAAAFTTLQHVARLPLSELGRGQAASSYAISTVLYHAQFSGLPPRLDHFTSQVLRVVAPRVTWCKHPHSQPQARRLWRAARARTHSGQACCHGHAVGPEFPPALLPSHAVGPVLLPALLPSPLAAPASCSPWLAPPPPSPVPPVSDHRPRAPRRCGVFVPSSILQPFAVPASCLTNMAVALSTLGPLFPGPPSPHPLHQPGLTLPALLPLLASGT